MACWVQFHGERGQELLHESGTCTHSHVAFLLSFFLQVNIKQIGSFYLKIYQNNIFKIKII